MHLTTQSLYTADTVCMFIWFSKVGVKVKYKADMRILPPVSLPSFPKLNQTARPHPNSGQKRVFFYCKFYKEDLLWSFILSSSRSCGSSILIKVPLPFHVYYSHSSWRMGGAGGGGQGLSDHVINFKKTLTSGKLWVHSLLSHFRVCDVEQARLTVPWVSASATWRHTPLQGLAWCFMEPLMPPSPAETKPSQQDRFYMAAAAQIALSTLWFFFFFAPVHNFKHMLQQIGGGVRSKKRKREKEEMD